MLLAMLVLASAACPASESLRFNPWKKRAMPAMMSTIPIMVFIETILWGSNNFSLCELERAVNPARATLPYRELTGARGVVHPESRVVGNRSAPFAYSPSMNINPKCALTVSLLVALVPASLAQSSVREDRVRDDRGVPRSRDVRVVDAARPLDSSDRDFMEKAAKASMAEVAISRVAAARTSNPEVRRFAQEMVEDHETAIEQLGVVASARGVSLPAKDPRPEKWEKRDAKNFDRQYLDQMIDDHKNVVKLFEKQARDGKDADTVAYARKHLPKMQQHLQHAIDLKRALTDKRD